MVNNEYGNGGSVGAKKMTEDFVDYVTTAMNSFVIDINKAIDAGAESITYPSAIKHVDDIINMCIFIKGEVNYWRKSSATGYITDTL